MKEVTAAIDIDAPPEKVWAVLMDPNRLADWVTIHRGVDRISDVPLRRGSTLRQTLCLRGVNFHVTWTVVEVRDAKVAVWEGKGPAHSRAETEYHLSTNGDGGTHFAYENRFKPPLGPLGSAAGRVIMGGIPQREADATLHRLKTLAEQT